MGLHPIMAAALAPFAPAGSLLRQPDTHRGWLISFDYPPIPCRDFDWSATHPDYDGAEDACDGRAVHGRSRDDVIAAIDAWYDEGEAL